MQQAITHHQRGQLQEAERLYRAILDTQPKHPDANHNLGVMAVSLKKIAAALPLFKIALEANPNQGQFWLSYLDALIKNKQFDNARNVLEQGKKRGLTGEKVNVFEAQLVQLDIKLKSQKAEPNKLAKAIELREMGRYQEAQDWLNKFLEVESNDAEGWSLLSQLLLLDKKDAQAEKAIATAIVINPNLPSIYRNQARLLLKKSKPAEALLKAQSGFEKSAEDPESWIVLAACLGANQRDLEALDLVERALKARPNYAEAFATKGLLRLSAKNTSGAIEDFEKAGVLKPHLTQVWELLGTLRYQNRNLSGAIEALKKAQALEPDNVNRMINLGDFLRQDQRIEEAIAILEEATEKEPAKASAWINLGTALQQDKKIEKAQAAYKKALAINPNSAEVYNNLGSIAKITKDWEFAQNYFEQAITIKPDLAEAHSNLGITLTELGRLEDAETSYKKAIAIKPDYAKAHSNLGNTLRELGRLEDAEASYKKAIAIQPDYAAAHSNLGNILQELGRLEDAETSYKKAIAIKPDYAEAHSNLGNTLRELGRIVDAETSFKEAIAIKPNSAEAHYNLTVILQELGKLEDAETSLHRSLEIKSNPVSREKASPVIALLPFGRSGSLFLHSLFDGHPDIATLPGVYFKGWFGMDSWQQIAPDMGKSDWRERLVSMVVKKHLPLFDANNNQNVPGKPFGEVDWLSKDLGFMEMGKDRSWPFVVDQNAFAATFLTLLKMHESIDIKGCFELIHRAFEIAIRGNEGTGNKPNGHIFYHIHNPNPFERAHFLQHYPQAMFLHLIRNPVQSLESWLIQLDLGNSYGHANYTDSKFGNNYQLKKWSKAVNRVVSMAVNMRLPDNCLPGSRGVRLEDVKQNPRKTMPQLAAWMGISDHAALYESSFCGLQYWGPSSKATGKITGFDTKAIDQPVGRLFGPKDVVIFETLFWPLSRLYSYGDLDADGFHRQLTEIRPWLDEPLEFETILYAQLPDHTRRLKDLPQYRRLHHLLQLLWSVLDRDGTYQNMVQPLELNK